MIATQYMIIDNATEDMCEGLENCDFCSNKVNPACLEPDEMNLAERGGGYACAACASEIGNEYSSDEEVMEEEEILKNNVFTSVNIGDYVYDRPGKLLGKCFYKSTDNSETVCLENGRLAIWIKGFCLKQKKGWMFIEGDLKAFYKDCCQ